LFTQGSSKSRIKPKLKAGFSRSFLSWTAVLSGMAALLITVGVLQYRWTRQVTEATDAEIGNNVQSLMMDWHYDFYRNFSAICVALQVGPDSGAHDNWQDYLQRYAAWSRTADVQGLGENTRDHPHLVENIYIWETSQTTRPRLFRLNAQANEIEDYEAPANLGNLLARLQARSSSVATSLRAWEFVLSSGNEASANDSRLPASTSEGSDPISGWQFDPNIPALAHPIIHQRNVFDQAQRSIAQGRVDWIIIALDARGVRERALTALTNRYFETGQEPEYKVTIALGGDPHRAIYSSDSESSASDHVTFDATMNIFGPPPGSTRGGVWQAAKGGNSLKSAEWHSFSGPVWFPIIRYEPQQDPWVLMLEHRNGPLAAIVTNVWRKNLITGGVVLLLLAASMSLVMLASRRAHRLARLQTDFVASVSHDLRTPLAAIFSAGENITDGLVAEKADLMLHGSIITSQARQLMNLVDQILLFASTGNDKNHYLVRPVQVLEILESVRRNVAGLLQEAGFELEEQVQPGLPYIMGDFSALVQCLQNLVVNAVKYGGRSRWIGLSATMGEGEGGHKEVRISVRDHGLGIHSSELPQIFEPFYRSPRVVAAQIHGTGLGLCVAKRIAEAMGGRLSVLSEVGVGSAFTLHMPIAEDQDFEPTTTSSETDTVTLK
jgi:signal transduction histidine kinase